MEMTGVGLLASKGIDPPALERLLVKATPTMPPILRQTPPYTPVVDVWSFNNFRSEV